MVLLAVKVMLVVAAVLPLKQRLCEGCRRQIVSDLPL